MTDQMTKSEIKTKIKEAMKTEPPKSFVQLDLFDSDVQKRLLEESNGTVASYKAKCEQYGNQVHEKVLDLVLDDSFIDELL